MEVAVTVEIPLEQGQLETQEEMEQAGKENKEPQVQIIKY